MKLSHVAFHLITTISLFSVAGLATAQQVYKWTDEKGALHYSQTPPPARYSQTVDVKARPTSASAPVTSPTTKDKNTTSDSTASTSASAKATTAKLSVESCKTMQTNLDLLQTGRRLYEKDVGGERAYLTEERRAQQIQTYQQNIKNGCS